jgi:N-acetylneuraminic acid mutarotase
VGGYTGAVGLRSITAFSPAHGVRPAATLPGPRRYAAVAQSRGDLLIAGGTEGTSAQRSILRFDPRTNRVTRIGTLPHPLTHAAAASLGGRLYVFGGRGDALDSASGAIWSIDPATGRARRAGRLPAPRSDLGAVALPGRILLVGGRGADGRIHDEILSARPAR